MGNANFYSALRFLRDTNVLSLMSCCELHSVLQPINPRWQRLLRLLDERDIVKDTVPIDVSSFESFLKIAPEWASADRSFVFHRDHPDVTREGQPSCLVQRVQQSGLCFLHAPIAMHHYLLAKNTLTPNQPVGMIDLTCAVRNLSAKDLHAHIMHNSGGNSLDALRDFVGTRVTASCIVVQRSPTTVVRADLETYGPALVHCFRVHPEFLHHNTWQYVGKPMKKHIGHHAMLMIGIRTDVAGKSRFLLQNWWKTSQFVEVDVDYLEYCHASVAFVDGQPSCYQTSMNFTLFAETASDWADEPCEDQVQRGDWRVL